MSVSGIDFTTMRNAQLACIWEATARKAGNVHRYRDFADANYVDFLVSAAAIAPVLGGAAGRPVGETVLQCVRATREVAASNTNLGIILLLAPLAAAGRGADFDWDLRRLLRGLSVDDSRLVYEAVRLAAPGGLGEVEEGDIRSEPDRPLPELMALAADRDAIAEQYANGFEAVLTTANVMPTYVHSHQCLEGGIVVGHLVLMGERLETLIARKCGEEVAAEAVYRAKEVLLRGWPQNAAARECFRDFDAWLRADGNRRNPGTTADLIAAALFVMLQRGAIELPLRVPWAMPEGMT